MTVSAIAAVVNVLRAMGVTDEQLLEMRSWALRRRTVTLRFGASQTCKFLRKEEREVKSDTTHVHTSTIWGTEKSYTVTKVRFLHTTESYISLQSLKLTKWHRSPSTFTSLACHGHWTLIEEITTRSPSLFSSALLPMRLRQMKSAAL